MKIQLSIPSITDNNEIKGGHLYRSKMSGTLFIGIPNALNVVSLVSGAILINIRPNDFMDVTELYSIQEVKK